MGLPWTCWRRRAIGASLIVLNFPGAACGGSTRSSSPGETASDGGADFGPDGAAASSPGASSAATGDLQAFSRLTNTVPTRASIGGSSAWVLVDTGNPWVLLDPTTFPSVAKLPTAGGTIPSLLVATESTANPYVFATTSGDLEADSTFSLDGNVGCSVLCGYEPALDYRGVTLTLGPATAPSGLGASISESFTFAGGGTQDGVQVPRSRIVVTVSLEGTDYSMILDTGATDVTVSQAAFTALTSDGRVTMSGGTAETTSGTSSSSVTRAATVALGAAKVDNVVIAHDSSFDQNLAAVSSDVGHTIDGSLGGTFLTHFYVTIDYSTQVVTLAPYSDTSFIIDPGEHIGVSLGMDGELWGVASVTAAATAKGVSVGDEIVSIDGTALSSVSSLQAATLPFGVVGATKQVTFGAAQFVSNMTIPLVVEETLPLP